MDALITYGGDRVGYSAMRSLTAMGARVAVADPRRVGMSQWSRFCWRKYLLEHPYTQAEAFVDDVVRMLKDSGARFLLPAHSETEVLAMHRDRLPAGVILPLAGYEVMHMANDKGLMASYAREIGVEVPEFVDWSNWDELEDALGKIDYPMVVKLKRGYSAKWVFYPEDKGGVLDICKALVARYSLGPDMLPMVQRRVTGEKWLVACLYHEGKRIASFAQRVLREIPVTGGVSTLRVSERNEKMESFAGKLLDGMAWHGIAVVEFKYNPQTKEAWFIEINPRLWAAVRHAVASGVDLVALLYVASTQGPEKALSMVRPQRPGVVGRWWLGDVGLAVSEARRLRLVKALKLMMPGGADICDELWMDDPGATAGALARPVLKSLRPKDKELHETDAAFLNFDSKRGLKFI